MAELIGLAASAAGGGVFGLVGTALGRVASFLELKQAHAHEKEKWRHEAQIAAAQQSADLEMTAARERLAATEGNWRGLAASLEAEAAISPSYHWVNAVRSLTRPTLTLLLWVITLAVYFHSGPGEQQQIVETATFAATAATLWWFGDRGPRRDRE